MKIAILILIAILIITAVGFFVYLKKYFKSIENEPVERHKKRIMETVYAMAIVLTIECVLIIIIVLIDKLYS